MKISSSIYVYGLAWLLGSISVTAWAENAEKSGQVSAAAVDTPDLKEINRPALEAGTLDINQPRQPSFMLRENDGTEIREYRERDKPVEIQVRSSLGTYEVAPPNGKKMDAPNERRLPTIKLLNF